MQRKKTSLILSLERRTRRALRSLRFDRKGASPVVSTLILTAGVLAMSIAVLYWTYSMGKITNIEYTESTLASSNAVFERIAAENVQYNGATHELEVAIINCGKTDNITIAHVLVLNSSYEYVGSNITRVVLQNLNDGSPIEGNSLRIGSDASFTTVVTGEISSDDIYYARVITARGRNFDFAFTP